MSRIIKNFISLRLGDSAKRAWIIPHMIVLPFTVLRAVVPWTRLVLPLPFSLHTGHWIPCACYVIQFDAYDDAPFSFIPSTIGCRQRTLIPVATSLLGSFVLPPTHPSYIYNSDAEFQLISSIARASLR